jgi:hypothetical protein
MSTSRQALLGAAAACMLVALPPFGAVAIESGIAALTRQKISLN